MNTQKIKTILSQANDNKNSQSWQKYEQIKKTITDCSPKFYDKIIDKILKILNL